VLPLVGSTTIVSGSELAGLLGRVDHGDADAVLDAVSGVIELQLGSHLGDGAFGHPAQVHQRGIAN
jgi:hypothetical protein